MLLALVREPPSRSHASGQSLERGGGVGTGGRNDDLLGRAGHGLSSGENRYPHMSVVNQGARCLASRARRDRWGWVCAGPSGTARRRRARVVGASSGAASAARRRSSLLGSRGARRDREFRATALDDLVPMSPGLATAHDAAGMKRLEPQRAADRWRAAFPPEDHAGGWQGLVCVGDGDGPRVLQLHVGLWTLRWISLARRSRVGASPRTLYSVRSNRDRRDCWRVRHSLLKAGKHRGRQRLTLWPPARTPTHLGRASPERAASTNL